jgi:hypothetical protein
MEAQTKSIEKVSKTQDAISRTRASLRQPDPSALHGGFGFSNIQQAAGNLAIQRMSHSGMVQAKLTVNQPGDLYEQEADHVAEQVMSSASVPSIHRKCDACADGGPCLKCEEEQKIQTKELPGHQPHFTPKIDASLSSLSGGGRPLPPSVRAFFELRFGRDFSSVRVHTDGQAAETARAIQARAFTAGPNIVLGAGEYTPESVEGKRLLAHELTHVVQQHREGKRPSLLQRQADGGGKAGGSSADSAGGPGIPSIVSGDNDPKMQAPELKKPPPVPNAEAQQDALKEIKKINSDFWIVFWQEYRLEHLWNSFGKELPKVAWENKAEWDKSLKGGADLYDIPSTMYVSDQFRTATVGIARGYLNENRALVDREKNAIGPDPKAVPTQEQLDEINSRRDAAQRIIDAEQAMAALRMTLCGYDRGSLYRTSDCHPIVNKEEGHTLQPTHFNPKHPPARDTQGDECIKMPKYADAIGMWNRLMEGIEGETAKYPVLFALTRNMEEKQIATKENTTAASSRAKMLEALNKLIENIDSTDTKLNGELDLELFPIHQQLFAFAPWSGEFHGLVAHQLVNQHASDKFWNSMGLGTLSAALFIVASLATGGLAAVLFGAAAGISAGQAINSWEEFSTLSAASKTNLTKRTELVTSGQANAALFTAVLDTVFAFLDIYSAARGVTGLSKVVARGSAPGAGAAAKTVEEAVAEEGRAVVKNTAEIGTRDASKVGDALRKGGAHAVTDEVLKKEGYLLEVGIEEGGKRHWYRQLKDGSWCKFSTRVCGITLPDDISRLAEGARRGFEIPAETLALKGLIETTEHEAPRLISAARIAETTAKLAGEFPVLSTLKPGAIERIVRAGYAVAEGGGLRRATRAISAAKGQLLEEISATRIRSLLETGAGREAMGLGHLTEKPILIEGYRITDAAGAKLTDGIIAIQRGDRLEIVAIIESKAGAFAAEGLEESLIALKRASTSDIIQAIFQMSGKDVTRSGLMVRIKAIDPVLHKQISETMGADLASQAKKLKEMREPLINAINKLSDDEIKALKAEIRTGEGQVSRDIERLMKEGKLTTLKIDGQTVTVAVPHRPSFVGVTPSDVPTAPIEARLKTGGYNFKGLSPTDMGQSAMRSDDLGTLAEKIVNTLGPDLERATAPTAVPAQTP